VQTVERILDNEQPLAMLLALCVLAALQVIITLIRRRK